MDNLAIKKWRTPLLIVIFVAQLLFAISQGSVNITGIGESSSSSSIGKVQLQPMQTREEYRVVDGNIDGIRRRLAPFQLCLPCKCCASTGGSGGGSGGGGGGGGGGAGSTCATMPCCFGIDCQLPNKPFGVCAFVPKTCNCTSCATDG